MICETISRAELNPNLPSSQTEVTLTTYARSKKGMLADDGARWGVLILPGGGYAVRSVPEAEPVALTFLSMGVQAFVLNYSIAPDEHPLPLLEAAAAMAYLRANRKKYGISRVAVCGFSAGGHLAGCLSNLWQLPMLTQTLKCAPEQFRPDAAILAYPVVQYTPGNESFRNLLGELSHPDVFYNSPLEVLSLEKSVTPDNPPTFLWATVSDDLVPVENTFSYAQALLAAGVPLELHLFPKGPHAMGVGTRESAFRPWGVDPHVSSWTELCRQWLSTM